MIKQTEEASKLLMSVKDVQSYLRKDAMTIIGFFESINDKKLQIMKDVGRLSNFFDTYTRSSKLFFKVKGPGLFSWES
jgi:hypothetical protein